MTGITYHMRLTLKTKKKLSSKCQHNARSKDMITCGNMNQGKSNALISLPCIRGLEEYRCLCQGENFKFPDRPRLVSENKYHLQNLKKHYLVSSLHELKPYDPFASLKEGDHVCCMQQIKELTKILTNEKTC